MATRQMKHKYDLRSIHEEIGLYDRKLAHLLKYDEFASDKDRDAAARKLTSKRNLLVRDAHEMIESGIEYSASELPVSLRTPEQIAAESAAKAVEKPAPERASDAQPQASKTSEPEIAPFLQKEIQEYLAKRRVRTHAAAERKTA